MTEETKDDDIPTEGEVEANPEHPEDSDQKQEQPTEPEEFEVALQDEATSPIPAKAFNKRMERFQRRLQEKDDEIAKLRKEREQAPQGPPTLEQYDFDSAKYTQAMAEYQSGLVKRAAEEAVQGYLGKSQQQAQAAEQEQKARAKIEEHYQRSDKLRLTDYDAVEGLAFEHLGDDVAREIVTNVENSELVMYYLGKHPEEAQSLAQQVKTNPVQGVMAITRLSDRLVAKPKGNKPPEPDEPVEGGSAGPAAKWDRELDKAREKAQQTGDMSGVLALKRKMREAGVEV